MTIRATVPVNLRDPGPRRRSAITFGLVFLELPIGIRDPLERLFVVHASMTALKNSYQPVLTLGLMAALGLLPGIRRSRRPSTCCRPRRRRSPPTCRARSSRCTWRAGESRA